MFFYLPLLIFLAIVIFWLLTFIYTSFRGSPYVPIKKERYGNITKFIKKGDKVADLGCGDGRVLIEAIRKGASEAHGWELDFFVYLKALWKVKKSGLGDKITLHFGDFWHADLHDFNVVYVYQMTKYLKPMKQKIISQLKKGTLIISPDYKIPGMRHWKHIKDGDRGIYVYKIN